MAESYEGVILRLNNILERLAKVEAAVLGETPLDRVKNDLVKKRVYGARLERVPSNYYDLSLSARSSLLRATSSQLCKSIIVENTSCTGFGLDDFTNSRYYCVVVQYEAKFDSDLLKTLIHELRDPKDRLPKKRFHFVLAEESTSLLLTGYGHNAISPYGMLAKIPVVICSRIQELSPAYIYLGGGEVDIKLGVSFSDFVKSTNAIVGKISEPR